jgi:hypothetical protein
MKLRLVQLVFAILMLAAPVFPQGCAMCYSSATAANQEGQRALSRAVTVLLIPPVGLMAGIVGFGVHYSRRRDRQKASLPEEDHDLH